ncbi:cholecystokinin receptor type A-like [Saccostrea cucullata]|uniref:cholecystokinin receptor type A-like n=1 Tax=Saccostrea cuccullata TaxID=36930 RepID=UPI002ED669DA
MTNILSHNITQMMDVNFTKKLTDEDKFQIYIDDVFGKVYIPSYIFIILMLVLGCFGNTTVIYVFYSKWHKTTYRVFIIALAILDLVNVLVTVPSELYLMQNAFKFSNEVFCKVSRFCTFTLNISSAFTLISIAGDRYFRVCRPLQKQLSVKKAKIIVLVGIIIAIVFAWPVLLMYGTRSIVVQVAPQIFVPGHICMINDAFKYTAYSLVFSAITLIVMFSSDCILIILYSLIVVNIRRRVVFSLKTSRIKTQTDKKQRDKAAVESKVQSDLLKSLGTPTDVELKGYPQEKTNVIGMMDATAYDKSESSENCTKSNSREIISNSSQNEKIQSERVHKVTLMLFLVTVIFILSFLPLYVIVFIRIVQPNHYNNLTFEGKATYSFFQRSFIINMCANPVLYGFLSKKFRMECGNVLKRLWNYFQNKNVFGT